MFKTIKFLALFSALIWTACGKDDPSVENDEELITTVRLTFTPEDGSAPVNFEFKDLDGNGGNSPVITNGLLKKELITKRKLVFLTKLCRRQKILPPKFPKKVMIIKSF